MPPRKEFENHEDFFLLPPKKRILREFQMKELQNHSHSLVLPLKKRISKEIMANPNDRLASLSRLKRKIEEMRGSNLMMIIEKELFKSDLSLANSRLSIPENKIHEEGKGFLKPCEVESLEKHTANNKREGINVLVLDPNLRKFNLILKKWSMRYSSTYNLTQHWNDIVKCNNLKVRDIVQLWSFRMHDDKLAFALVKKVK